MLFVTTFRPIYIIACEKDFLKKQLAIIEILNLYRRSAEKASRVVKSAPTKSDTFTYKSLLQKYGGPAKEYADRN